jgi:hypothetical protein
LCAQKQGGRSKNGAAELLHAAFVSVTIGRCLRPFRSVIFISSFAPGLPRTSAQGRAHGDPRGHRGRGSYRGFRFAGYEAL